MDIIYLSMRLPWNISVDMMMGIRHAHVLFSLFAVEVSVTIFLRSAQQHFEPMKLV
jgi:hypothetical protein